jgi:hypothetical protein
MIKRAANRVRVRVGEQVSGQHTVESHQMIKRVSEWASG